MPTLGVQSFQTASVAEVVQVRRPDGLERSAEWPGVHFRLQGVDTSSVGAYMYCPEHGRFHTNNRVRDAACPVCGFRPAPARRATEAMKPKPVAAAPRKGSLLPKINWRGKIRSRDKVTISHVANESGGVRRKDVRGGKKQTPRPEKHGPGEGRSELNGATGYVGKGSPPPSDRELHRRIGSTQNPPPGPFSQGGD